MYTWKLLDRKELGDICEGYQKVQARDIEYQAVDGKVQEVTFEQFTHNLQLSTTRRHFPMVFSYYASGKPSEAFTITAYSATETVRFTLDDTYELRRASQFNRILSAAGLDSKDCLEAQLTQDCDYGIPAEELKTQIQRIFGTLLNPPTKEKKRPTAGWNRIWSLLRWAGRRDT